MKILVIIVLLLLMLAGGLGGYYYFFVLPNQEEMAEPLPPPPDSRFVEMDSLRIPVIRGGVVVSYVILSVSLETIGPANEKLARSLLPRVRNAFITDLNGYFAAVPVENSIMVKDVKRRLLVLCGRVLGQGVVNDVLIQNAFKQKT